MREDNDLRIAKIIQQTQSVARMQAGAGIGPILYFTWLFKDKNKTWTIPLLACVPLVFLRFRRIESQKIKDRLEEESLLEYH